MTYGLEIYDEDEALVLGPGDRTMRVLFNDIVNSLGYTYNIPAEYQSGVELAYWIQPNPEAYFTGGAWSGLGDDYINCHAVRVGNVINFYSDGYSKAFVVAYT